MSGHHKIQDGAPCHKIQGHRPLTFVTKIAIWDSLVSLDTPPIIVYILTVRYWMSCHSWVQWICPYFQFHTLIFLCVFLSTNFYISIKASVAKVDFFIISGFVKKCPQEFCSGFSKWRFQLNSFVFDSFSII